jgi:hypothetical protein
MLQACTLHDPTRFIVAVHQWRCRDSYTTCGLLTLRQVWGEGVRAGMYPISDHEMYW